MGKTWNAKPGEVDRRWYVVDADGQTLGRLSTRIAATLRGKNKPQYTPHVDTGDFVVVVNAEKIAVTGNKLDEKMYHRHSGYPGGLRSRTLREQLDRRVGDDVAGGNAFGTSLEQPVDVGPLLAGDALEAHDRGAVPDLLHGRTAEIVLQLRVADEHDGEPRAAVLDHLA